MKLNTGPRCLRTRASKARASPCLNESISSSSDLSGPNFPPRNPGLFRSARGIERTWSGNDLRRAPLLVSRENDRQRDGCHESSLDEQPERERAEQVHVERAAEGEAEEHAGEGPPRVGP